MKVLVCGSRCWTDYDAIYNRLAELPRNALIIHGAARGADSHAALAASRLKLDQTPVPADWSKGKRGGLERNLRMLDLEPELVLAFWDGGSRGTMHTVREAHKRGIPVEIIRHLGDSR